MSSYTTPAILLHRIDYGDYDLILTFFTPETGKITLIAKSAKKSVKRFGGLLGQFAILEIACATGRGKGLPILQEASLGTPLPRISTDIIQTAYASYWAEIITTWCQEGSPQASLYRLLSFALTELDRGEIPAPVLSLTFQMKFLSIAGMLPHLTHCSRCKCEVPRITGNRIAFDIKTGRLSCSRCAGESVGEFLLTKGTVRQLQWMAGVPLEQVSRIRGHAQVIREGQAFLETFLPYHLGKKPKSLTFLEKIRK